MYLPRELNFTPSYDVEVILHTLLDTQERRERRLPHVHTPTHALHAVRCNLESLDLSAYHSQTDPAPRQTANEQFQTLERLGLVKLAWLRGETGHLLGGTKLNGKG